MNLASYAIFREMVRTWSLVVIREFGLLHYAGLLWHLSIIPEKPVFVFLVTNAIFRELQKTLFFTSEFMHVMQFLKVVNTRFSQLFHIYHCRLYFLWLQYYPLSIFNKILRINHICCYFISCSVQGLSWYVLFIRNCLLICLFYKVND